MIDRIIHFSLHHRLVVMLGVIAVVLGGFYAISKMDIDVFPDLTAPTVVVMTDCNGMAAEETERLVTFPIETALNGATNVRRVRSASYFGYSYVWVEFDWGMDVFRARQIVSEKMVTLAEALPENITPQLAPQSSVMGEILFVGLQVKEKGQGTKDNGQQTADKGTSQMELRSIADWVIKPVVLATGGVSQVTIIGGDYKQYQVMADPQRMNACGITMDELAKAVSTMSANAEGGVVRDYGNEYALRGMGRTNDIEELSATLIKDGIRISDVAKIHVGPAVKMGTGSMNARPAVILSISKQPNINTLDVTRKIEANLEDIKSALPDDVVLDTHIFRQADFIESSVNNVGRALIEGAVLCIIILFLFLGSMRTTVISVAAIPLSLLGTIIVLWLLDMDINTMTLGGMCIAIGSLVDDAIIDVENVYKRLKDRCQYVIVNGQQTMNNVRSDAQGLDVQGLTIKDKVSIIFDASKEIRSSILYATAIVIVAFIPMFFLSGMEGRMLKPLGITYIVALAMSLIVAMTVTPLFCRFLLTDDKYLQHQQKERRFVTRMHDGYKRSLTWVLGHGRMVLGSTVVLFIAAIIVMCTFGSSFLPDFNEGALTITAVCPPGVSLEETDRMGQILEQRILEVPEVASTSRRTGRGELDEHSQATNSMEIDVSFKKSSRSNEEITQDIRKKMATVPGIASIVGQPLGHRIDHMISGTRASIAIKIFGNDLSEMYSTAQNIKSAISDIEGLVDINIDQQVMTPQLHIKPNREAMARCGITMDDFNSMISYGFSGEKIGEIYEGQRAYDLVLRYSPEYSGSIEGVRKCPLLAPIMSHSDDTDEDTRSVSVNDRWGATLSDISAVVSTFGPNSISRENVQRKLVIAANVSGRDVGSVVSDIRKTVDSEVRLPEGYRLEYGGQFESAQKATRILVIATIIALLVIYLLLYAEFKSFSLSAIVMAGLPLALIGGVLGIAMSSWVLSIPSIIGFITLFGIATRNSILLVERYRLGDVVEGSLDRLNPILMTALTSALALIPLIINGDKAGNEIQSPMAIVVLGGLITSTLLNLYVMPVIYELYIKKVKG